MSQVAIVTDSTHYLPRRVVRELEIHEVSLYVTWDGVQQRELEIEDYTAFYDRLRDAATLPTTSQPSIGDYLAVWEPLLAQGHEIVSIHLAGGISGTCEAARQARAMLAERGSGGRVEVIDSETCGGGLGCVILAAMRLPRGPGADRATVVARAREARGALKLWFAVDTLEYLRRGGRVGKAQAWLGGALQIKPILSLEREITPVERVRTSGRAMARLQEYMRERRDAGADGWVVQHIQAPERAQQLVDAGREIFGSEPIFVSEVGPVIGTYTGPGLLGVGGVPRSLVPAELPLGG